MTMRVSLLHWNRPVECRATLMALRSAQLQMDVTIVDNGSTAENLAKLTADLPDDVELLALPTNIGWGPAHNIVLRRWLTRESSAYCLVSAHDALPQGDCLARLLQALATHADWAIACPEYGQPERPHYSVLRGARLLPVPPRDAGTHEEVDYCHGTLAIFKRSCLQQVGVFDERCFAYGDETEIGLRARRHGWKVGLVWGAKLINPGSWSGGPVIAYLWTRNSLLIARECGGVLGLFGRFTVVALATIRESLRGASTDSLSSPPARWRGIFDYFRGCTGGPPAEVLALRNKP